VLASKTYSTWRSFWYCSITGVLLMIFSFWASLNQIHPFLASRQRFAASVLAGLHVDLGEPQRTDGRVHKLQNCECDRLGNEHHYHRPNDCHDLDYFSGAVTPEQESKRSVHLAARPRNGEAEDLDHSARRGAQGGVSGRPPASGRIGVGSSQELEVRTRQPSIRNIVEIKF